MRKLLRLLPLPMVLAVVVAFPAVASAATTIPIAAVRKKTGKKAKSWVS